MAGKPKAVTTLTFAVTFQAPEGKSVKDTRELLKKCLTSNSIIGLGDVPGLKIHLTNKEVSYGKR